MVSQQFNNQVFYIRVASRQGLAFLCLENDVLNFLHLRGRPRQAALFRVAVHVCHAPFGDVQVRMFLVLVCIGLSPVRLRHVCISSPVWRYAGGKALRFRLRSIR